MPLVPRFTAPLTAGDARGRAPPTVAPIPAPLAISPKVASDHFCIIGSRAPNAPPIFTPFATLLSIGAHLIAVAPSFAVGMRAVVAILPNTSPAFAPAEASENSFIALIVSRAYAEFPPDVKSMTPAGSLIPPATIPPQKLIAPASALLGMDAWDGSYF